MEHPSVARGRTQSNPSARFRELSSTEPEYGLSQRKGSWVGAPTVLASLSYHSCGRPHFWSMVGDAGGIVRHDCHPPPPRSTPRIDPAIQGSFPSGSVPSTLLMTGNVNGRLGILIRSEISSRQREFTNGSAAPSFCHVDATEDRVNRRLQSHTRQKLPQWTPHQPRHGSWAISCPLGVEGS